MLKIGDFSKLSFVPVKTLRYYDELGLLKPARVDESSGYRYYSASQLPRLHRILALKDLGLSLEQIAMLLREDLSVEQIRGIFRLRKAEVEAALAQDRVRLLRVEAMIQQIEREGKMPMFEVVLKSVPDQRVASIRRTLPTYQSTGALFGELLGPLFGTVRLAGPALAVYHDREFKEEDVDIEVAIPVEGQLPPGVPARARELTGGQMACVVFQGPYEGLSQPYGAVMQWIESNGYRIVGPVREVYLRSPGDTRDPSEYVTEIQVPVERS